MIYEKNTEENGLAWEGREKPRKSQSGELAPDQYQNPGPPEYEEIILTTR